ncbi:2'-5' RNA ligase family protein [Caulobacter sp. RHG1]|uniref:2'-5' RNA ligase family protein n=1 Tax=Caulobacter sp. (strain RHG1) TaxID=2545762 RepID=UPI001551CE2D|nr:2'-5' RNA ligase family protein [Caulobacter sp. RHG1]NQE64264.1 putative ligase protein [Caulobacter sp. RHG1]
MTQQMGLPGFDPPTPTDRLMFLLYPDAATAERIAAEARRLKGALGLRGAPLLTERFHITLHHLGDYVGLPNDIVARGRETGVALAHAPFDVTLDRAVSFANRPGNNPFTLQGGEGVETLIDFQKALGEKMARTKLKPDKQFVPHVTLLYDGQVVPAQAIDPIGWTVDRFVLVQSKLGQTQHIVLGEWGLNG